MRFRFNSLTSRMLKKYPLHPVLFSVQFILFLVANNIGKFKVSETFLPLAINLSIFIVSFLFFRWVLKSWLRAGMCSTTILFFYSAFGHFYLLLIKSGTQIKALQGFVIGYLILFVVLLWLEIRILKNVESVNEFLNVVSGTLFLISVVILSLNWPPPKSDPPRQMVRGDTLSIDQPDIYYIVLDGYGGRNMISDLYGFDNHHLISTLENLGFYVLEDGFSNYGNTIQSFSSTLNFNYLDQLENENQTLDYQHLVENSALQRSLIELGYSIRVIPNTLVTTSWSESERYGPAVIGTPFFFQYVNTTALIFFTNRFLYSLHTNQILDQFALIEKAIETDSPKFVFAHILSPHPPFVFDENGNRLHPDVPFSLADGNDLGQPIDQYQAGYIGQLKFINQKIIQTIETILVNSKTPPVIVIQGDHGPRSFFDFYDLKSNQCLYENYSILNALYLPGIDYQTLPENVSPVNNFRIVLNSIFHQSLEILDDKAFYSSSDDFLHFSEITDAITQERCRLNP